MSHQRAEMLADQVGQLTARIAELEQALAVCDVCCKQRARDCEDARNAAREVLSLVRPAYKAQAITEKYPWLREKPTP